MVSYRPFAATTKESQIEKTAVEHARRAGWLALKAGTDGWPDRLFIRKRQYVWCEFKRPGNGPRENQERRIQTLRDHGCNVFVVDTWADCDAILVSFTEDGL